DELTAGLDEAERERIKRTVAVMNGLYGAPQRLKTVAADLVAHWEARSHEMRKFIDTPGKGMIVCATREICARLYDEIITLRPEADGDAEDNGKIKVAYSGGPSQANGRTRSDVRRRAGTEVIQQRPKSDDEELEPARVDSMGVAGSRSPPVDIAYRY